MTVASLLHNPKAGSGKYDRKELESLLRANGYQCRYMSVKKRKWGKWVDDEDILIVAGGDGTVKKVALRLLERKLIERRLPVGILPLGTANNIAGTLYPTADPAALMKSWDARKTTAFDVGVLQGARKHNVFLEAIGFGLFPAMVKKIDRTYVGVSATPEDELVFALKMLRDMAARYPAQSCKVVIDGKEHSGNYLLVEVMNTRFIGARLDLNPGADTNDGYAELVMIPESDREKFRTYLKNKLAGSTEPFYDNPLKGREITIHWSGSHAHIDDNILKKQKGYKTHIKVERGLLDFLQV